MKKGLSPVLGFVLVLLISIILAGSVIAWIRTTTDQAESEVEEMSRDRKVNFYISNVETENGDINITITNNGRFSIPIDEMRGYYKDEPLEEMEHIEGPDPIPPGETAKFRIKDV